MSPEAWERRLRKRGVELSYLEDNGFGYCGDCHLSEWTAIVEPAAGRYQDNRFAPVVGVGIHPSRDEALRLALKHMEERLDDLEREIAVLALAGT